MPRPSSVGLPGERVRARTQMHVTQSLQVTATSAGHSSSLHLPSYSKPIKSFPAVRAHTPNPGSGVSYIDKFSPTQGCALTPSETTPQILSKFLLIKVHEYTTALSVYKVLNWALELFPWGMLGSASNYGLELMKGAMRKLHPLAR